MWNIRVEVEPLAETVKTLLNYGALGAMVVVLGFLVWKFWSENKQLYLDRIAAEQRFASAQADMIYKYRELMERLNQTLDVLARFVGTKGSGGGAL